MTRSRMFVSVIVAFLMVALILFGVGSIVSSHRLCGMAIAMLHLMGYGMLVVLFISPLFRQVRAEEEARDTGSMRWGLLLGRLRRGQCLGYCLLLGAALLEVLLIVAVTHLPGPQA